MSPHAPAASGALLLLLIASQPSEAQQSNFGVVNLKCSGAGSQAQEGGALDFDLSTGYRICRGMTLTSADGRISISAGQASSENGIGFENHIWRLTDGIQLAFDDAEVSADSAELVFDANELVSADIQGSPAELSDFIEESNTEFYAAAERITYDRSNETLRIPGQASFRMGEESFKGCNLVYTPPHLRVGTMDEDCTAELRFVPQARDSEPDAPPEAP